MASIEIKLPKLGESISEATILRWLKQPGDQVEKDEPILEVATDKVDSEVAAPEAGVIGELLFNENDVVPVGTVIAKLKLEAGDQKPEAGKSEIRDQKSEISNTRHGVNDSNAGYRSSAIGLKSTPRVDENGRFLSPLVRSMAAKEGIDANELASINGSGSNGRVLKSDFLNYLENRSGTPKVAGSAQGAVAGGTSFSGGQEIIEMDRMRAMIADHMVESKRTSPHVTAYVEVDVTKIVEWREKNKVAFQQKYGEKITFTPIFVEAVIKALEEYPMVNVSVDGKKIIKKNEMNIGMAAALPSGNLIVPVIHKANELSLLGLTKKVNELTDKARNNKLSADEIQGGTFTISNVGTFRNLMGTPIINQPQVAILATGAIKKRPAVVETEYGDMIAIRHMMYLSLSFDHRVVDGNLGGSFLARIMDHMEAFDSNRMV
ncbi:MAG: diapophytoene dehydrogenase [Flavobacteriales bacterium]|nr:diapophytoene dehydrogenase [Flavobacteriales bacterium]